MPYDNRTDFYTYYDYSDNCECKFNLSKLSAYPEKDFQDNLFQFKIEEYKEMNISCYAAIKRLDINSSPFVQIYDFKEKADWIA